MNQIHTSYKTSKMLKEFLGESAPEPMVPKWVRFSCQSISYAIELDAKVDQGEYKCYPLYQLHDLLSKPFCEAMAYKLKPHPCKEFALQTAEAYSAVWNVKYFFGGMEAVEKALLALMDDK